MKNYHPLKPHRPRLRPSQLIALMVATFVTTVAGGLYGPQLVSRLVANDPALSTVSDSVNTVSHSAGATHYSGCNAAHAAGVYSIPRSSPAYREEWDGDGDGLACEPHRRH